MPGGWAGVAPRSMSRSPRTAPTRSHPLPPFLADSTGAQDQLEAGAFPTEVCVLGRERTSGSDDLGSPPEALEAKFGRWFDVSGLPQVWWYTGAPEGEDGDDWGACRERCVVCLSVCDICDVCDVCDVCNVCL